MYMRLIIAKNANHFDEHVRLISSFGLMRNGSVYVAFAGPDLPKEVFSDLMIIPKDSAEFDIIANAILQGRDVTVIVINNRVVFATEGLDSVGRVFSYVKFIKEYYEAHTELNKELGSED